MLLNEINITTTRFLFYWPLHKIHKIFFHQIKDFYTTFLITSTQKLQNLFFLRKILTHTQKNFFLD
jgi:hypothetical protein